MVGDQPDDLAAGQVCVLGGGWRAEEVRWRKGSAGVYAQIADCLRVARYIDPQGVAATHIRDEPGRPGG